MLKVAGDLCRVSGAFANSEKTYSTKVLDIRTYEVITSIIMRISRNQYVTFCILMVANIRTVSNNQNCMPFEL